MIGLILIGAVAVTAMVIYDDSKSGKENNHEERGSTFFHGKYRRVTGKCHKCHGTGRYRGKTCNKCGGDGKFSRTTWYD